MLPLFMSKQYYVTMHFSKWIRPGDSVYRVKGLTGRYMAASLNAEKTRLTVVMTNQRSDPKRFTLSLPLPGFSCYLDRQERVMMNKYRTTMDDNMYIYDWQEMVERDTTVEMAIDPMSVVTVIVECKGKRRVKFFV